MSDNLSIAIYAFARRMLAPLSVDEMLLPKYVNIVATLSGVGSLLFKTHEFCFICVHIEVNASFCLHQVMQ